MPSRARSSIVPILVCSLFLCVSGLAGCQRGEEPAAPEAAAPEPAPPAPAPSAAKPPPPPAPRPAAPPPPAPPQAGVPSAKDVATCNEYASSQTRRDNTRVLRDGAVGAAVGAGVGAAGGAIAAGGKGAGKGAGIGAVVGAAAGTLYGLDQESRKQAGAEAAYRECMARLGY